jgi:ABC-type bacteriocin/lantibiotic exporter with double-glycine peptidase domain
MHLSCRNITFHYPDTGKPVLRDLDWDIRRPGFSALFGPSGVGKTSLARLISGDAPSDAAEGEIVREGIARYAYTYNLERLPGWAAVGRHLERVTPEGRGELRDRLVAVFGLERILGQRFAQLSLGQKNRINLVRYLLQDFQLLILDESMANVDEMTRERILLAIKAMFPETFFIYISHNVVEVATFCRDILVLRGPHKTPQGVKVAGLDLREGEEKDPERLDRVMLEIVNAA